MIAALIALLLAIANINIPEGTAVVISTLAAAAGWLFKNQLEERQRASSLCRAYAAFIRIYTNDFKICLSETEIDRFIALADGIKDNSIAPTPPVSRSDPFDSLPPIKDYVHLFSSDTIIALYQWRTICIDLFGDLDQLGTKPWAELSHQRLMGFKITVGQHLSSFDKWSEAALHCLARDYPFDTTKVGKAG